MLPKRSPHVIAILQALFVTFLWSTSIVLIKIGLKDIPALTFAGLRYTLAFLCLLPLVVFHRPRLAALRTLPRRRWALLVVLGLVFYAATQGAQFVGLDYLPAITFSLVLNFTPVVVAVAGIAMLGERPSRLQWGGVGFAVLGALIYFSPAGLSGGALLGYVVAAVGLLANAGSSILGRRVNRAGDLPPVVVTVVSMGGGRGGAPAGRGRAPGASGAQPLHWAIIGWLAVVNTAFAFTLWNHTLRTLPAMQSSVINNTMLIQVAVLAWLFLGERPTLVQAGGLVLAGVGALLVQLRRA
ncbi:MAG: DMT family transporter [Anaerolineae bacterium]|nr:DMT family transporter [Anaerolineae bacterium]